MFISMWAKIKSILNTNEHKVKKQNKAKQRHERK